SAAGHARRLFSLWDDCHHHGGAGSRRPSHRPVPTLAPAAFGDGVRLFLAAGRKAKSRLAPCGYAERNGKGRMEEIPSSPAEERPGFLDGGKTSFGGERPVCRSLPGGSAAGVLRRADGPGGQLAGSKRRGPDGRL